MFALRGTSIEFEQSTNLRRALDEGVDAVIIGDSTLHYRDERDTDHRNIVEMLRGFVPSLSFVRLSNGAYMPDVYAPFCRRIARDARPPKIVILEVNMRSFSPVWDMRPMNQFEKEKITLAFHNTPYQFLLRPLMALKAFNFDVVTQKEYLEHPVTSGGDIVGQVKDFDNDSFNTFSEENLQKKFTLSYMYDLHAEHRKIQSIVECIEALKTVGVRTLFYITPVDWEAGVESLGTDFTTQLQRNVRVVEQAIQQHGGEVVDLSQLLSSADFNWRVDLYPNEHLAQRGRAIVAERLSHEVVSGK